MILGKNLIVSIDGTAVAGSKSCTVNVSQNFLEVCAPTESRTLNKVPTTYSWDMSVECLIASSTLSVDLIDKLILGTRVLLTFTDGSGQKRAGYAYVKNCSESGAVGSLATFSASFEADGALMVYTTENPSAFEQGYDVNIVVNDGGVTYTFNGSGAITLGRAITTSTKKGAIIIDTNSSWVLYDLYWPQVTNNLNQQSIDFLDEHMVACGTGPAVLELNANQYYSFLLNSSATKCSVKRCSQLVN